MKLFIVILSLLTFFIQGLFGQVVTFNKEITLNNPIVQESFYGVTELGDNYYLLGYTDMGAWNLKLVLTSINKFGTVNWIKLFYTTENQYVLPGEKNAIITTSDSCIAMAVAYKDSQYEKRRTMLIKVDTMGDILLSKILNDTLFTDQDSPSVGLIETKDHGFAILGQVQIMGILYKTDSNCELEWYKTFGNGTTDNYVYLHSIEETPDDGFLIGAQNFNGGIQTSGLSRFYRIDNMGNLLWSKFIDGPLRDYGGFVKMTTDSTWIALCSYTLESAGIYPYRQIFCVRSYDISGNMIWEKFLGNKDDQYTINSLNKMDDGTILLAGTDIYHTKAWFFNITIDGDSLFYREYSYPSKWDTMRRIIDAKPTYDGGIIACGEFGYPMGGSYIDHAWLLKTDRYGCMEMGCDSLALYIVSQLDTLAVCRYDETYLTMETMGAVSSFQWQRKYSGTWVNLNENYTFSGTNSDTLFIKTNALVLSFYEFRCLISNAFYEVGSEPMVLKQIIKPEINKHPKDFTAEVGDPAIFTVEATGTYPLYYQWYKNEDLIENANDSIFIVFSVAPSDSGYYDCVVSNPCDSVESEKAQLHVSSLGINQDYGKARVTLFPNPAEDIIYVVNKPWGTVQYIFHDMNSGLTISEISKENKINISHLKSGIYLIKLINNEATIFIGKIIKK